MTNVVPSELLEKLRGRTKEALGATITLQEVNVLPEIDTIKAEVPHWYRVDNVVAVVADLRNSTGFNTGRNEKTIARFYEAYMGPLVQAVSAFGPGFIDIQGDGLFALFSGDGRHRRALCAAITAKTFSRDVLLPALEDKLTNLPETGLKVGIASGPLFVKRVGIRGNYEPIWAGKPVNWAAKCAQVANVDQMIVTQAVWERIESNDYVRFSCGCGGSVSDLWREVTVEKLPEGQQQCHVLTSGWCKNCGDGFCAAILDGKRARENMPAS